MYIAPDGGKERIVAVREEDELRFVVTPEQEGEQLFILNIAISIEIQISKLFVSCNIPNICILQKQ